MPEAQKESPDEIKIDQPNNADQTDGPGSNEDPKTDEIVDDIMADESDELLKAHDEKLVESEGDDMLTWRQKLKDLVVKWWQNPVARWATLGGVAVLLAAIIAIPPSRYFLLNAFGVRSRASLNILDDSSEQPLKNVQVSWGGQIGQTDKDGKVTLQHIKLGGSQLGIEKRGFAAIKLKRTVGWGSNPLGTFRLTPEGTQFDLTTTDFLSKKPIAKAEASSGDASALSDEKGVIKLTIEKPEDEVDVTIKADGYRDEHIKFSSTTKQVQNVKLVTSHKATFVSKRSGKYDLYKVDADGQNEQLLLAGTGLEQDGISLVPNSAKDLVAMVSTREDKRNADGYLLSTLTLVSVNDGTTIRVAQSERIQVIGWVGSRLIYVQVAAGSSAANPRRNRINSYDADANSSKELASANYFNDMQLIGGKLYYAPSNAFQLNDSDGLIKINADGTNKQTILGKEVWNMFRTSYDHLVLSLQGEWDDYQISTSKITKLSGAPSTQVNRVYVESPDGKHVVWADTRDGKGVLLSYDPSVDKDTILHSQNGLYNPINWLSNNTLVYRVNSSQETADYVLNIDGGSVQKLRDVTNTTGIDKWYYY